MKLKNSITAILFATSAMLAVSAQAKTAEPPVTVNKCDRSYGTIAVVEGDSQGWAQYGLGSPRDLIAALATESGCFTVYNQAGGTPARFLMNVIAGDKEEVNKGVQVAKAAAVEGLVRSGAASRMFGGLGGGMGGKALGMLGGMGGKKKTVAAGIRIISPSSGQTMITGIGEVSKSSITFGGSDSGISSGGGLGNILGQGAQASGYASSKDGQMLIEAFIKAFNSVSAQGPSLSAMTGTSAPVAAAAASAPSALGAIMAVDGKMFTTASATSAVARSLRAGANLSRTGKREGKFIEVDDGYGTRGWVSVEDLR